MSTETLYPTAVTTPSAGGVSCSGTDTARTCTADSNCADGLVKATADHTTFQSPSFQAYWSSVNLKIVWNVEEQGVAEDDCSAEVVYFKYTLNASSWTTALTKTPSGSSQSGTYTKSLSTSQNIGNVQVRIDSQATANSCVTGRCCYGGGLKCSCRIDTEAGCSPGDWTEGEACDGSCWVEGCT